jgi:hypothetical protein
MSRYLRQRISQLEQRICANPIVLYMADGTVRRIAGTTRHYFKLVAAFTSKEESPLDLELEWIKCAVRIVEPAHLFELLHALLQGPAEGGQSQ